MVNDNVRYGGEEIPVDLVLSDFAEKVGFKIKIGLYLLVKEIAVNKWENTVVLNSENVSISGRNNMPYNEHIKNLMINCLSLSKNSQIIG